MAPFPEDAILQSTQEEASKESRYPQWPRSGPVIRQSADGGGAGELKFDDLGKDGMNEPEDATEEEACFTNVPVRAIWD